MQDLYLQPYHALRCAPQGVLQLLGYAWIPLAFHAAVEAFSVLTSTPRSFSSLVDPDKVKVNQSFVD